MESLKDKVAIITGASSGIGEGVAVHLASLGCRLVLTGRTQEKLDRINNSGIVCTTSLANVTKVDYDLTFDNNIRCHVLMTKACLPYLYLEENAAQTPLGRTGLPHDCAQAVAFLASDASSFISGETLFVDGARSLVSVNDAKPKAEETMETS
ncbi:Y0419-like protein [Mya arenaria]|uniref:Y0419-like protein n=1 Tax=Mya arenaria TaxID=6604 RepID=A0ABY7GB78_MYAAR|nr:Y0419-like protein [Mya arenaria]